VEDIVEPAIEVTPRGTILINNCPGTGYHPQKDLIEKLTVRKETISECAVA
jgi:hypothetical protein